MPSYAYKFISYCNIPLFGVVPALQNLQTSNGILKNFLRPVLSKKRPFTACLRPVHGLQVFTANLFFIRPVLSYFAVVTATWQHCPPIIFLGGVSLLPDPARTPRSVQPKKLGRKPSTPPNHLKKCRKFFLQIFGPIFANNC
jgi:hypothetical protein